MDLFFSKVRTAEITIKTRNDNRLPIVNIKECAEMASALNPLVRISKSPPARHMTGNTISDVTVLGENGSFLVFRKYTTAKDTAAREVITRPDGKESRAR